jgi:hypothetical protein
MQGVCYLNKTTYLHIRHVRMPTYLHIRHAMMQAWLADLLASASASRMEPTFRSRMQMHVQEVSGLALIKILNLNWLFFNLNQFICNKQVGFPHSLILPPPIKKTLSNMILNVTYYLELRCAISNYTLNFVVSHSWQPKCTRSFVVLTWMCDTSELV